MFDDDEEPQDEETRLMTDRGMVVVRVDRRGDVHLGLSRTSDADHECEVELQLTPRQLRSLADELRYLSSKESE